jgi:hypothetical protein
LLRRRGYRALDADWDGLNHWMHRATGEVMLDPPYPVPVGWLDDHAWHIDPALVSSLAEEADDSTVFLAGSFENELDVLDRFDTVICLVADNATLEHRLTVRETNEFGKHHRELAAALAYNITAAARYRSFGAVIVDATQRLDSVVRAVIEAAEAPNRS